MSNPGKVPLTLELIDRLAETVGKGNFRYTAVMHEGLSRHTFRNWVAKGKKELAEFDSGKIEKSKVSLCGVLVQKLGIAESKFHMEAIADLTGPDCDPKIKWDFLKKRYGKLYSGSMTAIDDEDGTEIKLDPNAVLAERLKELMDR